MKVESQVCSLEQAIELEKLGIAQVSLFTWKCNDEQSVVVDSKFAQKIDDYFPLLNKLYSAFTAAELIKMNGGNSGISTATTKKNRGNFFMQTGCFCDGEDAEFTYYDTFAKASAAKLIEALKKDWLDTEICNKRLMED